MVEVLNFFTKTTCLNFFLICSEIYYLKIDTESVI